MSGSAVCVGNDYGVDEVDVSDPTAPLWLARHPAGYGVRKAELAPDGRVFAMAATAGVFGFERPAAIFADGLD